MGYFFCFGTIFASFSLSGPLPVRKGRPPKLCEKLLIGGVKFFVIFRPENAVHAPAEAFPDRCLDITDLCSIPSRIYQFSVIGFRPGSFFISTNQLFPGVHFLIFIGKLTVIPVIIPKRPPAFPRISDNFSFLPGLSER